MLFPRTAAADGRAQIDLTDDLKRELASLYLSTNATRKSGSMTIAWDLFTQAAPGNRLGQNGPFLQAHPPGRGQGGDEERPSSGWASIAVASGSCGNSPTSPACSGAIRTAPR